MSFHVIKEKVEKSEDKFYFKLVEDGNGELTLRAAYQNGASMVWGRILTLSEKGIRLEESLTADAGLALDRDNGTVKVI